MHDETSGTRSEHHAVRAAASIVLPPCSIVIPVHNEAGYVRATVEDILRGVTCTDLELLLVENGSSDATPALCRTLAGEHLAVRVLTSTPASYGAAVRTGVLAARHDRVVVFDCDLWDLSFAAQAIADADATGAAVVVASKRADGSRDERSTLRTAGSAVYTGLVRLMCGLRASDTHGMKHLRLDLMRWAVEASDGSRHTFDTEVIVRCERAGLTVAELPCTVRELREARSGFLRRVPRALVELAAMRRRLRDERRA